MNIRTRLRALILATLFPVAALGAATAFVLVEKERTTLERGARDRVRAMMTAIDAELRTSAAPLEILARSPTLDFDDLGAFRAEAERALEARVGHWVNILVSQPGSAEMILNALLPHGERLFPPSDAESVQRAARLGHPTVSRVITGPLLKRPLFAVRVPVIRDGKPKYVLSAVLDIETINRLVDRQAFPSSWTVAVLDANYRFVVRWPPSKEGDQASASLKQALAQADDGWMKGRLLDGSEVYRAFQRSTFSGWSVSIAIPRQVVEQGMRATWLLFAGVLAAAGLGLWVAWMLAARITQPIAALAAAAPALGRGDTSALPQSGPIDEVSELARALGDAALAIRDREQRQQQAERALRSADRAKDEFLAMLGHELRNPLASIANAAQLLKLASDRPATLQEVGGILQRQVQQMTRLVDDLLEVGRVTGGKIHLERSPLDLARTVEQVIETWRRGGRLAEHEVRTDLQPGWVSGDRARLEQVVSNLLDNALKYTPAGGQIEVSVHGHAGMSILRVRDTGQGMSPELIARVFDLFIQGERTLAREPGGLGIGLTMTKRLVELHGGAIRASSPGTGQGATFTVTLPAIAPPEDQPPLEAPAARPVPPRRILVIEDNADARESLATLLRHGGHEVHTAHTGLAGLEIAHRIAPDLVLVDIGLPDVDGYAVARGLKANPAMARVRVVALTGYGTEADRERALAAGFDRHLVKPVDLQTLEELLRGCVAPAAGAATTAPSARLDPDTR